MNASCLHTVKFLYFLLSEIIGLMHMCFTLRCSRKQTAVLYNAADSEPLSLIVVVLRNNFTQTSITSCRAAENLLHCKSKVALN